MDNKPKSFEEFYYLPGNEVCDIDVLEEYVINNKGNVGKYEGNMYCPECREALLSFVHKTSKKRAHLRRNSSSQHGIECSYNYEYASSKRVKKYVDSLTYNEIQDKLNSIFNMLCKEHKTKGKIAKNGSESQVRGQNPMLIPEGNSSVLRALRRKKLNTWIDKSDGEDFSVFYGKVKLGVKEKTKLDKNTGETYTFYLLDILTQNKQGEWKYRTSIYRGSKKDEVSAEAIYNIVIIGCLNFNFNPFTIKLANRDAIRYQEADSKVF